MDKQEVINCNDGQALADAVAVEVMGWFDCDVKGFYLSDDDSIRKDHWQPHLPTEKGKAQAIDLAEKCELMLDFKMSEKDVIGDDDVYASFQKDSWQIAVLKAALLSVRSE